MPLKVLPSAHHIDWLQEVARTTEASGQALVAERFREIARALSRAETLNTVTLGNIQRQIEGNNGEEVIQ